MYYSRLQNNGELSGFRIKALQGVIFFLLFVVVARLFWVQIVDHNHYVKLGAEQRAIARELLPERGRIFALANRTEENLYPLAVNKVYYEVSVDPSLITRPQNITDIFVEVLELEEEVVLAKVKQNDRYELIAKEVPQEKVDILQERLEEVRWDVNRGKSTEDQVNNLAELGVFFDKHVLRYYPDKEIGAHILGFLGYSEDGYSRVGKYGLEGYWQNELAGYTGQIVGEADVAGRLLADDLGQAVKNGADLTLTIDRAVQYSACKSLERALATYDAESGTVVIMETSTGAIRAMCNYPSFDPNEYNQVTSSDVYNNLAVYQNYEPGSVMKSISMAIAIDEGKVSPSSLYTDEGEIKFAGGNIIRNAGNKEYGLVDMKEVLAASINTGIIHATAEVNNKIFADYVARFGFGEYTGLNISQDNKGNIASLDKKGDIFKATASYGQGITATPLQMLNAINVLANRGNLLQPYIVSKIEYADGRVEEFGPQTLRQVIDTATAAQLAAMMVNVIDSGHAGKAAVDGYYVAGKTGTAQVANPDTGKYYTDKTIHNFVGFAPNNDPQFTMIVKLDYPTAARYSADTAAPVFGEIAAWLLDYYKIAPER